jgi:hypothetical protein
MGGHIAVAERVLRCRGMDLQMPEPIVPRRPPRGYAWKMPVRTCSIYRLSHAAILRRSFKLAFEA